MTNDQIQILELKFQLSAMMDKEREYVHAIKQCRTLLSTGDKFSDFVHIETEMARELVNIDKQRETKVKRLYQDQQDKS